MRIILERIRQAEAAEIGEIFLTALLRYRELFPNWDIEVISIDKAENREKQLDRVIKFAERLKEK